MLKSAELSETGVYRYHLWRCWTVNTHHIPVERNGAYTGERTLLFIMLNPSTADHEQDDPTIRRCITFAQSRRYTALSVCNLFAYRATDPSALYQPHHDPIGPRANEFLLREANAATTIVMAWGAHGAQFESRVRAVESLLQPYRAKWRCFGLTRNGHPKHPLYLSRHTPLIAYRGLGYREETSTPTPHPRGVQRVLAACARCLLESPAPGSRLCPECRTEINAATTSTRTLTELMNARWDAAARDLGTYAAQQNLTVGDRVVMTHAGFVRRVGDREEVNGIVMAVHEDGRVAVASLSLCPAISADGRRCRNPLGHASVHVSSPYETNGGGLSWDAWGGEPGSSAIIVGPGLPLSAPRPRRQPVPWEPGDLPERRIIL